MRINFTVEGAFELDDTDVRTLCLEFECRPADLRDINPEEVAEVLGFSTSWPNHVDYEEWDWD